MTTRYYGASIGATMPADVVEATSTNSVNIELVVIFTASGMDKQKLLNAVNAIYDRIVDDNWPPA